MTISGGTIGAGVATHFATDTGGHQEHFKTFWRTLTNHMPIGVTVTVPNNGDTIEAETGRLVDVWSFGSEGVFQGIDQGKYPGGVGATIGWLTAGIVNGHRVRGRTFVVPLDSTRYATDGTLDASVVSDLMAAAQTLQASLGEDHLIWHRPSKGGSNGSAHPVVGYRVRDRVATLSSRR